VTEGGHVAAPRSKRLRAAAFAVAVVLVVGAPVFRVALEGAAEQRASDAALLAGNVEAATVHARRAASAYVPFAPHVDRAYRRLSNIAADAEARGDVDAALFAWRATRSASIGSSWLLATAARERRHADAAIARLMATARAAGLPAHRGIAPDALQRYAKDLASDRTPSRWRVMMLIGGFLALVGGSVWGARRALREDGSVDLGLIKMPALVALAGAAGWIAGLLIV